MKEKTSVLSFTGISLGAVALMLALVHFWAGPFSPQPTLEQLVADKAVSIKEATIAALKGEEREEVVVFVKRYDLDQILSVLTAVLGGLAVILGVVGYARNEPRRAAGGAAVLGVGAIAFQFVALALAVIVVVILISAVLGEIGI